MSTDIDITDLVEKARSTFVTWGVNAIFAEIIIQPYCSWLALPVFSFITKQILTFVLNFLSNTVVMQAFFTNTAIRKASQAQDYVDAVNAKDSLPPDVSDADYEKAELAEISSFNAFVAVTN